MYMSLNHVIHIRRFSNQLVHRVFYRHRLVQFTTDGVQSPIGVFVCKTSARHVDAESVSDCFFGDETCVTCSLYSFDFDFTRSPEKQ